MGAATISRSTLSLFLSLFLVLMILAGTPVPGVAAGSQVFGREGKMMRNFLPIPQWRTLVKRYREEEKLDASCEASGSGRCPYSEWKRVIEQLRGMDRMSQIRLVNKFANNWRYITDPVNWGRQDYWATPGEFFAKAGDCEDYAIVKFMSLRALGFENDVLKLVAVQDLNLEIGHAVTVVTYQGHDYLLDNQIQQVIDSASVHHYQPVFAANEEMWWLYK